MRVTKDFASLSPSILARKGGARPAMRSQLQPSQHFAGLSPQTEDDLGWNDMGHDMARSAEVVPLDEGNRFRAKVEQRHVAENVPEVVRQRDTIVSQFVSPAPAPAVAEPIVSAAPVAPLAPANTSRRSALAEGRRAAFTLRLDAERHLSLRLASTILNKSAQTLVTEALDRFLAEMPEVGALAGTIRKRS